MGGRAGHLTALTAHLLYNFGRITTYALIGGVMGAVGGMLGRAPDPSGMQAGVSLFVGAALILLGLMQAGLLPRLRLPTDALFLRLPRMRLLLQRLMAPQQVGAKFVLGLLLGFLPCMLTYAMFLRAMAAGSFAAGFLLTGVFGLGTLPMLFAVGLTSSFFIQRLRRYGNVIAAVSIIILGLLVVWRALRPMVQHEHSGMQQVALSGEWSGAPWPGNGVSAGSIPSKPVKRLGNRPTAVMPAQAGIQ